MEPAFYINISIRTPEGPLPIGRFELGTDRDVARNLFKRLKGSTDVNLKNMLYIELMETIKGLPLNVDVRTCDLQELGINTMLITQEMFRLTNFRT